MFCTRPSDSRLSFGRRFGQPDAGLMGMGHLFILHGKQLGPLVDPVFHHGPHQVRGQHGAVALKAAGIVGPAHSKEGHRLVPEHPWIGRRSAPLLRDAPAREIGATVVPGTKPVQNGVKNAGGPLFKDRYGEHHAVRVQNPVP